VRVHEEPQRTRRAPRRIHDVCEVEPVQQQHQLQQGKHSVLAEPPKHLWDRGHGDVCERARGENHPRDIDRRGQRGPRDDDGRETDADELEVHRALGEGHELRRVGVGTGSGDEGGPHRNLETSSSRDARWSLGSVRSSRL
jgi:hypothetical protein